MKLLVDISRAEAEGLLTAEQGAKLRQRAAKETVSLAINVLLSLGVIGVAGGFLAFQPPMAVVIGFGVVLAAVGFTLRTRAAADWGFLGAAAILIGGLALSGGILVQWEGVPLAFVAVMGILALFAVAAESGLLAALAVCALAGVVGSSTGYWHAAYELWVKEPTVTILLFGGLTVAGELAARALPDAYARLATIAARLCLVWANFGFWIGSLWGDHPLAEWLVTADARYSTDWRKNFWLTIPDVAFAIVWALALIAAGIWAASTDRRGIVNTVAVFAGIHFYTQFFERLGASPTSILGAGVLAVGAAIALWRYNDRKLA